jgi:cell division protein ZapD
VSLSPDTAAPTATWLTYEFPFTERTRILLRLEDLFEKFDFFLAQTHAFHHHAALMIMFEIMDVGARADMKSELMQEMEKQRQLLMGFSDHADIDTTRLAGLLNELEQGIAGLNAINGRLGQHLRENDWLMSIRSRSSIPGGVCEFDLPGYHAWLQQSDELRRVDLMRWAAPMMPSIFAIRLVLRLLRERSGEPVAATASKGSFTQPMNGKNCLLLQVRVPASVAAIPEFSANKYMLWVRFNQPTSGNESRNRPFEGDLPFEFRLCTV